MSNEFPLLPDNWKEWSLIEELGEGAFGAVYHARKTTGAAALDAAIKIIRIPAEQAEVKVLLSQYKTEESVRMYYREMVGDYLKEIQAMTRLKGMSGIVSIEDCYVEEKTDEIQWTIYIRMELLESLEDYCSEHEMSRKDIIRLGIDICKAIEACESAKIIHRDIKTENIFVTKQGDFKLGDFGVARQADRTIGAYSTKGTYPFMAPEVYKSEPYGSTVDIYSLGIVLYRKFNHDRDPFVDLDKQVIYFQDSEDAFAKRIQGVPLPPPKEAGVSESRVILKACAYLPEDRYRNAAEMRADLEKLLYETNKSGRRNEDTFSAQSEDEVRKRRERDETIRIRMEEKIRREQLAREEKKKQSQLRLLIAIIVAAGVILFIAGFFMLTADAAPTGENRILRDEKAVMLSYTQQSNRVNEGGTVNA